MGSGAPRAFQCQNPAWGKNLLKDDCPDQVQNGYALLLILQCLVCGPWPFNYDWAYIDPSCPDCIDLGPF